MDCDLCVYVGRGGGDNQLYNFTDQSAVADDRQNDFGRFVWKKNSIYELRHYKTSDAAALFFLRKK